MELEIKICSVEDARRMLEETGCDAIMIGRAALGNPWLIKQVVERRKYRQYEAIYSYRNELCGMLCQSGKGGRM